MISYLSGKIIDSNLKYVTVLVNGVGYKVFTNNPYLESEIGKEIELFTYLAVRENALDLYGFKTKAEITFFELLLTVSGIGPKSALTILSLASPSTLSKAIKTGDSSSLVKISGIGKKNAEKIVLELKDKNIESNEKEEGIESDIDTIEALSALGYSERDIRDALKNVEEKTTQDKIRQALKILNR